MATFSRKQKRQQQKQAEAAQPAAVGETKGQLTLDQAYTNVVAIGRAHVCNADQRDLINSSIEMLRLRCLRASELEAELADLRGSSKTSKALVEKDAEPVATEAPLPPPTPIRKKVAERRHK